MPRRKTFEEVKAVFEERGYKLVSSVYKNSSQKLEYVCPGGHKGSITFDSFKHGSGCSICAGNKKKSIEEVREIFEARGYKLLTSFYKNAHQKLNYVCPEGHRGSITLNDFKSDHGCPICAGNKRKTIDEVREAFEVRGYKLLTSSYINSRQKLNYVCPEGHHDSIRYADFSNGSGCSVCAGNKKKTISEVREVFEARGYKLLTSSYKNIYQKLNYVCPKGHRGSITFDSFKQGHGCPVCAGNKKKTIEEVREAFEIRKYKLLTSFYINSSQKLKYVCPEGHKGFISFSDFKSGYGCSICAGNKKKTIDEVREVFEARGYSLITSFYVNNSQKLDYVCPKGHYGSITYGSFYRGRGCSICGQKCSIEKRRIPFKTVVDAFEARGYKVTSLEDDYKGITSKISYICPKGHKGAIRANSFISGGGCSKCAHEKNANMLRLSYDEVKKYFESYDYILISTEYENTQQKLDYVCPKGHKGSMTLGNFKQGKRCPRCVGHVSRAELSLRKYVISLIGEDLVEANIKSVIHPWELDIYIPSKKLAIEYCGLYWHSELSGGKAHDYHRNKMDLCLEKNIRLITIFEDEFKKQPEVVKSRIKNALGKIDNRIYARKTVVKRIDNKAAYKFLEENHLQGKGRASVSFGLFYKDRLLQVLTVGHLSRAHASFVDGKKVRMLELKRFASVGDTVVVGGASKLFKHVKKYASDMNFQYIKSYSDNRYANPFNSVYEKLGFSCISETRFTPHYAYGENRYRNQALRKTMEERLTGKTEWELRREQGYDRIWDCGHKTFLLEL